jgi:hypothetical protein
LNVTIDVPERPLTILVTLALTMTFASRGHVSKSMPSNCVQAAAITPAEVTATLTPDRSAAVSTAVRTRVRNASWLSAYPVADRIHRSIASSRAYFAASRDLVVALSIRQYVDVVVLIPKIVGICRFDSERYRYRVCGLPLTSKAAAHHGRDWASLRDPERNQPSLLQPNLRKVIVVGGAEHCLSVPHQQQHSHYWPFR